MRSGKDEYYFNRGDSLILARYKELVELAKKYIEKGYKPIEAIKLAEKELDNTNN